MAEKGREPVSRKAYEKLADSYSARAPTKPHNAYYERPATLSLLGGIGGKRVLDAACGPGIYAEELVARGAEVVGFDASERMVELARERLCDRAEVFHANLEDPLAWLDDGSFDLVVSALAMDYVEDWQGPLAEFYRVLKPAGKLMFSVEHPIFKFVEQVYEGEGSYFETALAGMEWTGFGERVYVPSYRRPLGAMVDAILGGGFVFVGMLEPRPDERFRVADPVEYERLCRMPGFLCFVGRKPGAEYAYPGCADAPASGRAVPPAPSPRTDGVGRSSIPQRPRSHSRSAPRSMRPSRPTPSPCRTLNPRTRAICRSIEHLRREPSAISFQQEQEADG